METGGIPEDDVGIPLVFCWGADYSKLMENNSTNVDLCKIMEYTHLNKRTVINQI